MPEGPELASSRDRLRKILLGSRVVETIVHETGRYHLRPIKGLTMFNEHAQKYSLKIESIDTKGKFMWWTFSCKENNTSWRMWSTYGMSGRWTPCHDKHTAFSFRLENETGKFEIFFVDPRHFGTIKFVNEETAHLKKLKSLGPCVLTGDMSPIEFSQRMLKKTGLDVADALMDQSIVSGVGNYLRAEILYDCGISPWRNVTEISSEEYVKLFNATLKTSRESYEAQGATISTYRTVEGDRGKKQFTFKVYGRSKCPAGHLTDRRESRGGRTMWWCNSCQL